MHRAIATIKRYWASDSSVRFWWLPVGPAVGNYVELSENWDYYLDYSRKLEYDAYRDGKGIIQLNYKGAIGVRYNPCAIAQFGLGAITQYLSTGKVSMLDHAIACGKWFQTNASPMQNGGVGWLYDFGEDSTKSIKFPYISGIAQGQAISLLLRLYVITKDVEYKKLALSAFTTFLHRIEDGGIVNYDEDGNLYLEEFPTKQVSCVLDGFIFAIFAVRDVFLVTKSPESEILLKGCIDTLKTILPKFDLFYWSRTDLILKKTKMPASPFYHKIHVLQCEVLFALTVEKCFERYYLRWRFGWNCYPIRCVYVLKKAIYKILFY